MRDMKFVKWGIILLVLIIVTIFILPVVGATQNYPPSDNTLCDNNHSSGHCNIQQNNPQCIMIETVTIAMGIRMIAGERSPAGQKFREY